MDYNSSIKGIYDVESVATLRTSAGLGVNLDAKGKRFMSFKTGGHYSNTFYDNSSFKTKTFHVEPAPPNKEETPAIGRPLFVHELSKVVPPPNNYDIKRNIEIEPIKEKSVC